MPKEKKKKKKKDPNAPRRPMTSYLRYAMSLREGIRKKNPDLSTGEISRKIAVLWKDLPAAEKKDIADREFEQYRADTAKYKEEHPPTAAVESDRSEGEEEEEPKKKKKKPKKPVDPNAPKRPMRAFFAYCNEHRDHVVKDGFEGKDVKPELIRRWMESEDKPRMEEEVRIATEKWRIQLKEYEEGKAAQPVNPIME